MNWWPPTKGEGGPGNEPDPPRLCNFAWFAEDCFADVLVLGKGDDAFCEDMSRSAFTTMCLGRLREDAGENGDLGLSLRCERFEPDRMFRVDSVSWGSEVEMVVCEVLDLLRPALRFECSSEAMVMGTDLSTAECGRYACDRSLDSSTLWLSFATPPRPAESRKLLSSACDGSVLLRRLPVRDERRPC